MTDVPVLGKLAPAGAHRDAIHVAIAPIVASEKLYPGEHVGVTNVNGTYHSLRDSPVGIVDPFLKVPVEKGELFWLCIYQNTVTSLRHAWSHSSFKPMVPGPEKN